MPQAYHSVEMPHLTPVMQVSDNSLAFLMEDLQHRRSPWLAGANSGDDVENWVNALQRQAYPLVASTQGRANLEAWLALVDA